MKQQKSIQIRYATRDDISDITTIYAREVIEGTATFELDPPTEQEMLERFYALWNAQYPTYVATIDNKVVGYAYANMFRPRPAYRFTVEDSIYIAPNWQRYGVYPSHLKIWRYLFIKVVLIPIWYGYAFRTGSTA